MIALDASQFVLFDTVVQWFSPWQHFFSHSKVAQTGIMFVHLAGLLFAGGFAVAADRTVLRATSRRISDAEGARAAYLRTETLETLHTIHRPVIIGLTFVILSGLAMALGDVETFATSPVFWSKMGLFVLLSVNGLWLMRTETALRLRARADESGQAPALVDPLWGRLRFTAFASMILWTVTLLAGTILANS